MFTYIAYILYFIMALLMCLGAYNVLCVINMICTLRKNKPLTDDTAKQIIQSGATLDLWKKFILHRCKKHLSNSIGLADKLKKSINITSMVALITAISLFITAFEVNALASSVYQVARTIENFVSGMHLFLGADRECICYAKCTGNEEDDGKTAYELLFGPNEYAQLIDDMTLSHNDLLSFNDIEKKGDIQEISNFIIQHINSKMITDYKNIVGNNANFRKQDGLDRTKMTDAELQQDLIKLFSDHKEHGRNPNCKACKNGNESALKMKCMGEEHYVEGWKWDEIWEEEESTEEGSEDGEGCLPGHAEGKATIKLNDGTWYWYHQSSCECDNNVKSKKYGNTRFSSLWIYSNSAAGRGCSMYATAMALSNLAGEEITPWDVANTVLKGNITKSGGGYSFTQNSTNRGYTYKSIRDGKVIYEVCHDYNALAKSINEVYGDKQIKATVVPWDKKKIDKYLEDDDSYSMVVTSWQSASGFSWYNGGGHFMVIRKKDKGKDKYYCLNSAKSHADAVTVANTSEDWDTMTKAKKHNPVIVITRPKSAYAGSGKGSSSGSGIGYNKEVYDILKNTNEFGGKAKALAYTYAMIEPVYGKNFAIGMMANVKHEGDPGRIEYAFSQYHYFGFKNPSGKTKIASVTDMNYLLSWTTSSAVKERHGSITYKKGSCGVGSCGWSYGRRITLVKIYKKLMPTDKDISDINFQIGDLKMMMHELENGYKSVANKCKNQSASKCASILTLEYEKPWKKYEQAAKREITANTLYNLLKGVTTHGATAGIKKTSSGSSSSSSTSSSSSLEKQVYNKLKGTYSDKKAKAMAKTYALYAPKYSKNFAIGAMANIVHEGEPGLVEYSATVANWDGKGNAKTSTLSKPLYVSSKANAEAIKKPAISKHGDGYGVGIIGFTFYRKKLAEYYIKKCKTYSQDELFSVELNFLTLQIETYTEYKDMLKYKNSDVKTVAEKWCRIVEKPGEMEKEVAERRAEAPIIEKLLKGIGTKAKSNNSTANGKGKHTAYGVTIDTSIFNYTNTLQLDLACRALASVGNEYKWAGTNIDSKKFGVSGADCSGFTLRCYKLCTGINLTHSSVGQRNVGKAVALKKESVQAGDLMPNTDHNHVALCLGNTKSFKIKDTRGRTITIQAYSAVHSSSGKKSYLDGGGIRVKCIIPEMNKGVVRIRRLIDKNTKKKK